MQSSSTNSGVSTINVYFEIGRDPDLAAVDVQNRVNQVLGRLPADVRTTGVTVTKNTAGFLGGLGFFSRDNRYNAQFISNYLDLYVRDALKRVPGVGNVIIFGERKYAMRLWLDPARLAARAATAGDVGERAARAEPAGRGRRAGGRPRGRRPDVQPQHPHAGPADRALAVRERGGEGRRATARWCACGTWGASSWGPRPTRPTSASSAWRPAAWACSSCRPPTPSTSTRA